MKQLLHQALPRQIPNAGTRATTSPRRRPPKPAPRPVRGRADAAARGRPTHRRPGGRRQVASTFWNCQGSSSSISSANCAQRVEIGVQSV